MVGGKNVTAFSGRALEYEKALPRKGKVFQMKCLPLSSVKRVAKISKFGTNFLLVPLDQGRGVSDWLKKGDSCEEPI